MAYKNISRFHIFEELSTEKNMNRRIKKIYHSRPTTDGAGVSLNRVFSNPQVPEFDPFLLLDAFGSDDKSKYIRGFPWHPHRGIETITYLLQGRVEHGDSMGNEGIIYSGDVQWMTAGSGIIHQEMPKGDEEGKMYGFQLWANLPAKQKMIPPKYRDVKSIDIPNVELENGIKIKIICGKINETKGPVTDIATDPEYLDISVLANTSYKHKTTIGHTYFAYIFEGEASFSSENGNMVELGNVVLFEDGEFIEVSTKDKDTRFLLISGKPIGEPVAWYGPIVMNTDEEIRIAFEEYEKGTFIKNK
jgi:redox-sensitive bicupin YhaK (pirin superfamily)